MSRGRPGWNPGGEEAWEADATKWRQLGNVNVFVNVHICRDDLGLIWCKKRNRNARMEPLKWFELSGKKKRIKLKRASRASC